MWFWLRVFHDATVKLPAREIWRFQWGQRVYSQAHFYGCWLTSDDPPSSSLTDRPQFPTARASTEAVWGLSQQGSSCSSSQGHLMTWLYQENVQWVKWQSQKDNVHVLSLETSGYKVIWVFAEITKFETSRLRDHSVLGLTYIQW